MRISAVETYITRYKEPQPVRWRDGIPTARLQQREDAWIRVATDEGIDGWCFVPTLGGMVAHAIDMGLREVVVGEDALDKEKLWHAVWELDRLHELPIYALGVVDVALWDITAKVAGLPLYRVLGGYRSAIDAYASTATFSSPEEYLDVIDQCLELGFRAIKLHAWGDARRDARLCELVRDHVGDDVALMYDGSAAFFPDDALRLGRVCERLGYLWYEEPMREFQLQAYRQLSAALDIPVLGAETSDGCHHTAAEWLTLEAADSVRACVDLKGGVTGALRILHLADAFGRRAEVHGDGLPNLHLCCAVRNTSMYEAMILSNPVERPAIVGPDGRAHVPQVPGMGYETDAERPLPDPVPA